MDCDAYSDLVAADVDGRLSPTESAAVDSHLVSCRRCVALRLQQAEVRGFLRERAERHRAPAASRERLLAALAAESEAQPPRPRLELRWSRRRTVVALIGSLAAALVLILLQSRTATPDLVAVLASDVKAVDAGQMALAVRSTDLQALRDFYRPRVDFEQTVADFGRLGFTPIGAAVDHIGGVKTTFTVYRSSAGMLVCRRFRAGAIKVPEGGRQIGAARLFTVGGVNVLIHRDGDAICCLASTLPLDPFAHPQTAEGGTPGMLMAMNSSIDSRLEAPRLRR